MADPEILSPLPPDTPPNPVPPPNTVFRGPNGIRAGWRVLIFVAIAVALILVTSVVLRLFVPGARTGAQISALSPLALVMIEGPLLFFTAVPALLMAWIENRRWGQYGLPLRFALRKDFWIGSGVGFLAISGCLLAIFALHGFHLTGLAIHGSTILSATAAWGATFILVGLAEEFSFRGYLQYTLSTGMGFWPSAFLLSVLFGLAHKGNPGETWFGLFSVVLFGLLFCLFLRRTGNLWWAVGFHAGWDWGQTFFYGVPDSGLAAYHNLFRSTFSGPQWLTGGSVGPEASVFTPITLLVVGILFSRVYRQNRYQTSDVSPQTSPATQLKA